MTDAERIETALVALDKLVPYWKRSPAHRSPLQEARSILEQLVAGRPAHMCRIDHPQIWHNESGEDERCPLCQVVDERDAAQQRLAEVEAERDRSREAERITREQALIESNALRAERDALREALRRIDEEDAPAFRDIARAALAARAALSPEAKP